MSSMAHIDIVSSPAEIEVVRDLFREYASSLEVDLGYQNFPSELAELPGAYASPDGRLLVANVGDDRAGCVAIRRLNDGVCEMKRLYVRPAHRGAAIGRQLVLAAIDVARGLGYREMWLDTLPTMSRAQKLYVELGFQKIDSYGSAHAPGTRFYGLRLVP